MGEPWSLEKGEGVVGRGVGEGGEGWGVRLGRDELLRTGGVGRRGERVRAAGVCVRCRSPMRVLYRADMNWGRRRLVYGTVPCTVLYRVGVARMGNSAPTESRTTSGPSPLCDAAPFITGQGVCHYGSSFPCLVSCRGSSGDGDEGRRRCAYHR